MRVVTIVILFNNVCTHRNIYHLIPNMIKSNSCGSGIVYLCLQDKLSAITYIIISLYGVMCLQFWCSRSRANMKSTAGAQHMYGLYLYVTPKLATIKADTNISNTTKQKLNNTVTHRIVCKYSSLLTSVREEDAR
jgi:hypothetical protein